MDGDTGLEAILQFLGLQVSLNDSSGLRQLGRLPFNLSQGWQASGGLHEPAWQPGVVGQGRGSLRVRAKNSPIQVLLLAAVECAIVHNVVQVFPEEIINMEVALFDYFMLLGLT